MVKVTDARAPAVPSSPRQQARRRRILSVASALASNREVDDVGMQEIADESHVAIATLYRYFPSKTQLFLSVMSDQIDRIGDSMVVDPTLFDQPDEAVHAVLARATRYFLERPTLADAMLESSLTANREHAPEAQRVQRRLSQILLDAAGRDTPTDTDQRLLRLLIQTWYGILQSGLTGQLTAKQAERELRLACHLLLAPMMDPSRATSVDTSEVR